MSFSDIPFIEYFTSGLDIALVWLVIYKLLDLVKGTKAVQLLKGIILIIVIRVVSSFLGLNTLQWLMDQAITWGFLAIIIIFQPELRRALEQLGRGKLFSRTYHNQEEEESTTMIQSISKSVEYLAKRRIGALISLEQETGMDDYVETGIGLHSKISSELLINIFIPNTPLHDGAVIIQKNQISAAACYLPLSENPFISKELGTRHRAALGISEVTDSLTIVVSEETGTVSVAKNGELHRDVSTEKLTEMLVSDKTVTQKQPIQSVWNWKVKKNG
jgi:diadenylate cyclase